MGNNTILFLSYVRYKAGRIEAGFDYQSYKEFCDYHATLRFVHGINISGVFGDVVIMGD